MKLAVGSLVIVGVMAIAASVLMPPAHAQISSIGGFDQPPPLLPRTCFATIEAPDRQFRVEEVRNGWIRVATAADKNQTNPFVRIESRWLNGSRFQGIVTLSGPKACDFLD